MAETRALNSLRPHPRNAEIYNADQGESWSAFVASVKEQGILEPIVITSDGVIISGHRRWRAAQELGFPEVPVTSRNFADDNEVMIALIEYNRYREKTLTEKMREASVLEEAVAAQAKDRQGTRVDLMENLPECENAGKTTRDVVAAAIGVSGRTYDKMKLIHETAQDNPTVARLVEKLDKGETSVDAIYKRIRSDENKTWLDFQPKVYNYWFFGQTDSKYGQPHPGQIHPGIVENMLWFYTSEGDLVVDPFAGGGITIDITSAWGRRIWTGDIDPRRPDVVRHDIRTGYPSECREADLVILDPPYWNMVGEEYSADGAGSYSFTEFIDFLRKLAHDSIKTLKVGGHVGFIIMSQYYRLPEGVPYVDWPFVAYKFFTEAGGTPVQRIYNMWPTSIWQPFHVTNAKLEKKLLPIMGEMLVFQRRR